MTDFLCLGLVATCRIERLVYTCQLENIVINSIRTDNFAKNINMYFLNEKECVLFLYLHVYKFNKLFFEILCLKLNTYIYNVLAFFSS